MTESRYCVRSYDGDLKEYTPATEADVPVVNITKWQLRVALRALREIGYEGRRGDPALRVERIN